MKSSNFLLSSLVTENVNVVSVRTRGPETNGSFTFKEVLLHDSFQKHLGIIVELLGFFACFATFEDGGVLTLELPRPEKRRPVEEREDLV